MWNISFDLKLEKFIFPKPDDIRPEYFPLNKLLATSDFINQCKVFESQPEKSQYYEKAESLPTLSRCGSRKNYIPSLADLIDSSRCSEEGCLWNPSALSVWTI